MFMCSSMFKLIFNVMYFFDFFLKLLYLFDALTLHDLVDSAYRSLWVLRPDPDLYECKSC